MLDHGNTKELTPVCDGASSAAAELVPGVGRGLPTLPSDGPLPPERNPALLYLAGLQSAESRRTQRSALGSVVRLFRGTSFEAFAWHRLTYSHTVALRTLLAERLAPATANRYLGAVRGVLIAAWRLGLIDREAFEAARDVKPIRGARVRRGRLVRPAELRQLAVTAKADPRPNRGARDLAMVGVCYGGGLRRGEVARLDLASYDGASVVALGKGNKERRVPLAGPVRWAVDRWLEQRGRRPGPLFVRSRAHRRCSFPLESGLEGIRDPREERKQLVPCSPRSTAKPLYPLANGVKLDSFLWRYGPHLDWTDAAGVATPDTVARRGRVRGRARRPALDTWGIERVHDHQATTGLTDNAPLLEQRAHSVGNFTRVE